MVVKIGMLFNLDCRIAVRFIIFVENAGWTSTVELENTEIKLGSVCPDKIV